MHHYAKINVRPTTGRSMCCCFSL